MYVCICKGITDHQIRAAVRNGAVSMRSLNRELGVASQCSKCSRQAREVLREALVQEQPCAEGLMDQAGVHQWAPQSA